MIYGAERGLKNWNDMLVFALAWLNNGLVKSFSAGEYHLV